MTLSTLGLGAQNDGVEASETRQWDAEESGRVLRLVLLQAPSAGVEDGLRLVP